MLVALLSLRFAEVQFAVEWELAFKINKGSPIRRRRRVLELSRRTTVFVFISTQFPRSQLSLEEVLSESLIEFPLAVAVPTRSARFRSMGIYSMPFC